MSEAVQRGIEDCPTDRIYTAGTKAGITVHCDPDCRHLAHAAPVREHDPDQYPPGGWDWTWCDDCGDRVPDPDLLSEATILSPDASRELMLTVYGDVLDVVGVAEGDRVRAIPQETTVVLRAARDVEGDRGHPYSACRMEYRPAVKLGGPPLRAAGWGPGDRVAWYDDGDRVIGRAAAEVTDGA